MKHRVIYPGLLNPPEVILLTGAVYSFGLSMAAKALADGVRSQGYSVSICMPGVGRSFSQADQTGNPVEWDTNFDVLIVDIGEYLGGQRFRNGGIDSLSITRTVFFTSAVEPSVTPLLVLPHEKQKWDEIQEYLVQHLPQPVHITRSSLIRLSGAESMLRETDTDVLRAMEKGEPVVSSVTEKRDSWESQRITDRLPRLERALW